MEWKKLPLPTSESITGIYFPDDNLGYLVTDAGSILKTTDGGTTFTVLDYQAGTRLEDTYFLSDDHGFVFGKDGFLAETEDGGQTWNRVEEDSSYWFLDMNFQDDEHGFLTGVLQSPEMSMVGFIGLSTDDGQRWSFDTTDYHGLSQIDVLPDANIWISAIGNILYTTDQGQTWEHNSTGNPRDTVEGLFFTNIRYGWCVGDEGLLLYSSDGGWSWDRKEKLTQRNLTCITAPEINQIYIAGDRFIAASHSNGRAWEVDSLHYTSYFNDLHWTGDEVYLCGSEGTLLKLTQ
jgi:photosystem II stability/assembly factor-like uncharacterized protein